MKRIFDILFVIVTAPLWLPLMLIIAIFVGAILGRPVFFNQERPGQGARIFRLVKFRTMSNERDSSGTLLPDSERLGKFGGLLRSTSLDELPEVLNILRGEMSLVGPRPLLMRYLGRYSPRQARRHEVRPGLTGLAQVLGRNALDWQEKLELDVRYVETQSLWLDLKILFMTLKTVVLREGISAAGEATAAEFMGNPPPADAKSSPPSQL